LAKQVVKHVPYYKRLVGTVTMSKGGQTSSVKCQKNTLIMLYTRLNSSLNGKDIMTFEDSENAQQIIDNSITVPEVQATLDYLGLD
jgi:hypothetical protein